MTALQSEQTITPEAAAYPSPRSQAFSLLDAVEPSEDWQPGPRNWTIPTVINERVVIANELRLAGMIPSRVFMMDDSGLSLYFLSDRRIEGGGSARYASLTTYPGEVVVHLTDQEADSSEAHEIDPNPDDVRSALQEIREYLSH